MYVKFGLLLVTFVTFGAVCLAHPAAQASPFFGLRIGIGGIGYGPGYGGYGSPYGGYGGYGGDYGYAYPHHHYRARHYYPPIAVLAG